MKALNIFATILLSASMLFAAGNAKQKTPEKQPTEKQATKQQKPAKVKASEKCLSDLAKVKEKIPVTAKLANITWAEARARADQLERFEKDMPKSDLLPHFAEACSLYVELISLYAETDSLNASTRDLWYKRLKAWKDTENTQKKIGDLRSGKVNALTADLNAAKNQAVESEEEAKKREEALKAAAQSREDSLRNEALSREQALKAAALSREDSLKALAKYREDSLRRASELRENELQKALDDERAKAEARQAEAKEKLNKLQSKLIKVTEDARGIILSMSDILFDVDKATLKQDLQTSLAKVAGILSVYQELDVSVEGHTDNTGSDEHNMKLSEQRAKNVLEFLVSQGIDAKRLTSKGYGKTRPVGDNSKKEGRQKNRRVDLVIHDRALQGQK